VPDVSAQGVLFDTGFSVASGDYGAGESSTTLTLDNGLALQWPRVSVHAGIPLVAQHGDAILTGGGPVPAGRGGSGGMTTMGSGGPRRALGTGSSLEDYRVRLGDPLVSVSAVVLQGARLSASAGAAVKVPLAEAGDVGTGKWDGGVTLNVTHHLRGPWFGAAGLAWWKLGDPEGFDLRDPLLGSLMLTRLGDGNSVSMVASGSTPIADGLDAPVSGGVRVARDLWGGSASLSAVLGMTDSAADFSLGLGWGVALR